MDQLKTISLFFEGSKCIINETTKTIGLRVPDKKIHSFTHFEAIEEAVMLKNVAFAWDAMHFPNRIKYNISNVVYKRSLMFFNKRYAAQSSNVYR